MSTWRDRILWLCKMKENKSPVISYIKSSKPSSSSHRILSQDGYLDGSVAQVQFKDRDSKSGNWQDYMLWVVITKKHEGSADTESQLIQQMQIAASRKTIFNNLNFTSIVCAFISFVIISSFIYLVLFRPADNIPEYMKNLMFTVIAFYFGRIVQDKASPREES